MTKKQIALANITRLARIGEDALAIRVYAESRLTLADFNAAVQRGRAQAQEASK